jgi:hypothetical protein
MHAPELYGSLDIDMVVVGDIDRRAAVVTAMQRLGFSRKNGMFVHANNPYTVDFVPSPVRIGDRVIDDFAFIDTPFGPIRVLRAVDAVCDRLNKYIMWSDIDSLNAAVAVAQACNTDLARIADFIDTLSSRIDTKVKARIQLCHKFSRAFRTATEP